MISKLGAIMFITIYMLQMGKLRHPVQKELKEKKKEESWGYREARVRISAQSLPHCPREKRDRYKHQETLRKLLFMLALPEGKRELSAVMQSSEPHSPL